jgi:class 3 adenylate cyclase
LERAIDLAERIGARAEGARAQLDLAQLLARESDETAPMVARNAASELRSLEMPLFARTAEALAPTSRSGRAATSAPTAVAAVIVFTDLVDSTGLTERIGDLAYRTLADELIAELLAAIDACNGELIPGITLGDGVLALFNSARDAIAFGEHAHPAAIRLGVQIRVGIHAGDVLRIGDIVSGGAVNIAARVCATALPAETLVSQTVRGVARTSAGVTFEDRGEHELRGVSEPQRLFAVLTHSAQ